MWAITVQQLPKNLFQQGNEFHFTIFLVQWASFECVNSKKKNPFYQWISFELCTTSWRSLSSHLFIAPCSPLVALALVCSLFIPYNSSNVYFNEFTHLRRYESAFQPNDWFTSTWNHFSNIGSCVLACASVGLCVVITVDIDELCVVMQWM